MREADRRSSRTGVTAKGKHRRPNWAFTCASRTVPRDVANGKRRGASPRAVRPVPPGPGGDGVRPPPGLSSALAAECPQDLLGGQRGRQLACAYLLFELRCQGAYRRMAAQAVQQLVADHRPGPVHLLLA